MSNQTLPAWHRRDLPHAEALRVASVPAGHVYVRHRAEEGAPDAVVRARGPRPNGAPSTSQPRPHRDRFRVGVHAKSLRPNMSLLPVVRTLTETVADLRDAELNIHR